ncbi:hypothetical protein [Piscinibacter gummiphilus]|uniref:DUF7688 domain-containing protein n=1 Tax=Piscinibacter gummiphilus TaxID=946333 RepID=A0ABZ0D2A7_9BURK|nr:hypothetical protein [Piscinibacter gummiphilus]WOB11270.1 hypothetical protein RXV79_26935 [Piscinibacter gummiphilus]
MAVIFNNISGINFEGRRQAWLQYMAWMSWFHRSAWPGRESPFRDGAQIKLAPIGGRPIAQFTFPASFSADLDRVTHEQQA